MAVEPFYVPHFNLPFRFDNMTHHVQMVEQDTDEDVVNCVYAACLTTKGTRFFVPNFGISDYLFTTIPIDDTRLQTEILESEPRADAEVLEEIVDVGLSEYIQLGVGSIVN